MGFWHFELAPKEAEVIKEKASNTLLMVKPIRLTCSQYVAWKGDKVRILSELGLR